MNFKFKCYKCGNLVAKGEIRQRVSIFNTNLKPKLVFGVNRDGFQGAIIRNKSRNYKNWTAICSECQPK